MNSSPKEIKRLALEKECTNPTNTAIVYDVPIIIQWYLDGYDEIEVYPERKRAFLYFASANGLLHFTSEGDVYVAGMKVI